MSEGVCLLPVHYRVALQNAGTDVT
jgi:hypothetical protein